MSDITEINVDTGEITTRPYTEEEINVNKVLFDDAKNIIDSIVTGAQPQNGIRTSALEKLKALGLTEDEARAIVGI